MGKPSDSRRDVNGLVSNNISKIKQSMSQCNICLSVNDESLEKLVVISLSLAFNGWLPVF